MNEMVWIAMSTHLRKKWGGVCVVDNEIGFWTCHGFRSNFKLILADWAGQRIQIDFHQWLMTPLRQSTNSH